MKKVNFWLILFIIYNHSFTISGMDHTENYFPEEPPPLLPIDPYEKTQNYGQYATVLSDGKWKCKIFGRTYSQKSPFYRHLKATHLNMRYKCNLCEKAFSSTSNLTRHKKDSHSNQLSADEEIVVRALLEINSEKDNLDTEAGCEEKE